METRAKLYHKIEPPLTVAYLGIPFFASVALVWKWLLIGVDC